MYVFVWSDCIWTALMSVRVYSDIYHDWVMIVSSNFLSVYIYLSIHLSSSLARCVALWYSCLSFLVESKRLLKSKEKINACSIVCIYEKKVVVSGDDLWTDVKNLNINLLVVVVLVVLFFVLLFWQLWLHFDVLALIFQYFVACIFSFFCQSNKSIVKRIAG